MENMARYRWRKISDINREHASFELLSDGEPLLNAGFSDAGNFEIEFYQAIKGAVFDFSLFEALITDAKELALSDLD